MRFLVHFVLGACFNKLASGKIFLPRMSGFGQDIRDSMCIPGLANNMSIVENIE